jgi:hypothetical protein
MEIIRDLVLLILGSVGMTAIIVEGTIFVPVKDFMEKYIPRIYGTDSSGNRTFLMKLLNCYQCTGFWSGVFIGFLLYGSFSNVLGFIDSLKYVFSGACAASCCSVYFANYMTYLEANSIVSSK